MSGVLRAACCVLCAGGVHADLPELHERCGLRALVLLVAQGARLAVVAMHGERPKG